MSKDKAEEKARAIQARTERLKLISKIPLIKSNILYIAESGSINGSLMLSIEKLMDNYTESLSTENAQLREALREVISRYEILERSVMVHPDYVFGYDNDEWHTFIDCGKEPLNEAKQLLTDKE